MLRDLDSIYYYCQYYHNWHPCKLGGTYLHIAAEHNIPNIIEFLIEQGSDLEARQQITGHTPLFLAIKENNIGIVKTLLSRGVNVNHIDKSNKTCMSYVCKDEYETMNYLVAYGFNTRYTDSEGKTILHHAVLDNRPDLVRFISSLDRIDVNAQDKNYWTALHYSCDRGYYKLTKILLKHGANPNVKTPYKYHHPIHKVVQSICFPCLYPWQIQVPSAKDFEMIELLLKYGSSLYLSPCLFRLTRRFNPIVYNLLCEYEQEVLIKQMFLLSYNASSAVFNLPYEIIELIAKLLRYLHR